MTEDPCLCPLCGAPGELVLWSPEWKTRKSFSQMEISTSTGQIHPFPRDSEWENAHSRCKEFICHNTECEHREHFSTYESQMLREARSARQIQTGIQTAPEHRPALKTALQGQALQEFENRIRDGNVHTILENLHELGAPCNIRELALLRLRDLEQPHWTHHQAYEDLAHFLVRFPEGGIPWETSLSGEGGITLRYLSKGESGPDAQNAPRLHFPGNGTVRIRQTLSDGLVILNLCTSSMNDAARILRITGWTKDRMREGTRF